MSEIDLKALAVVRALAQEIGLSGEQAVRVIDQLEEQYKLRKKAEADLARMTRKYDMSTRAYSGTHVLPGERFREGGSDD